MEFKKNKLTDTYAIKITAEDGDKQIGRLFLYVLKNDLHQEPFGFLEDVFVEEEYRKHGIGSQLVKMAIEEAKAQGCYKLIGNSRTFAGAVHKFYEKLGFKKWGFEFRMQFKE
jgi:GNAT superfamily N-acetyltransferase